jgi:hypothetical protein
VTSLAQVSFLIDLFQANNKYIFQTIIKKISNVTDTSLWCISVVSTQLRLRIKEDLFPPTEVWMEEIDPLMVYLHHSHVELWSYTTEHQGAIPIRLLAEVTDANMAELIIALEVIIQRQSIEYCCKTELEIAVGQ